jgi:hypothetical protein
MRRKSEMVETFSAGNGVQSCETTRNSLGLNYEPPALTAELQAPFACALKHSISG